MVAGAHDPTGLFTLQITVFTGLFGVGELGGLFSDEQSDLVISRKTTRGFYHPRAHVAFGDEITIPKDAKACYLRCVNDFKEMVF